MQYNLKCTFCSADPNKDPNSPVSLKKDVENMEKGKMETELQNCFKDIATYKRILFQHCLNKRLNTFLYNLSFRGTAEGSP